MLQDFNCDGNNIQNLDVSNKEDAGLYEVAQQLQQTVSKGAAKPKYDAPKNTGDIV